MDRESDSRAIERLLDVVVYFAIGLELLAVIVIVSGVFYATYVFLSRDKQSGKPAFGFQDYRIGLGRTLLLGLEILVAADIVRTVVLDQTLENVAILGLLILIRTFLSWSLEVEIDSRWPWQPRRDSERN